MRFAAWPSFSRFLKLLLAALFFALLLPSSALADESDHMWNDITTLETVNSFYAEWCCANDGYLYGRDVANRTIVIRKTETGQAVEKRGDVASLDPSFRIENRILSTSTPGLIFVLVMNRAGLFFLLKSNDGGMTFRNVFAFGEGNGPGGSSTPSVRVLRGFLELTRDIPAGGGKGTLLIGEYNVSHGRTAGSTNDRVRIMKSDDNGDTWSRVMEWNTNGANQVGHIHAMKQDPYTGEIYVCTGDNTYKAGIVKWDGSSEWENNLTLSEIGRMPGFSVLTGLQRYRVCDVLFDEGHFYTFADTQKPNNPTGSESGIWRAEKDFSSYTRVDNKIYDYDQMHIGWYGEKIGDTFVFTTSREYINSENAWKEQNTQVYTSNDGINWYATGVINWQNPASTETRYITNVFSYNNRMYIDCVGGAGHNSTIQCELVRKWKTYEDPVILHPVYFAGNWNNNGDDSNKGINPDAPKSSLTALLSSGHISAGARIRLAEGTFYEPPLYPEWSSVLFQGKGSVVIEGQGMDQTHIVVSPQPGSGYGIRLESARTLTDDDTPLILKDLELNIDAHGNTEEINYAIQNIDSYIKTVSCRIRNSENNDSPLIGLTGQGAKYRSERSVHAAGKHGSVASPEAPGTKCYFQNCIILYGEDTFVNDQPDMEFSIKNCTLYGAQRSGVVFGTGWNSQAVIKNCIFSVDGVPVIDMSGTRETDIDYNLYINEPGNVTDGGHSRISTDWNIFIDASDGNFSLLPGSPGQNAGISLSDVQYDFDSRMRVDPPCIGAYENYVAPYITVFPSNHELGSSKGDTCGISLVANTSWTISFDADWLDLSAASGSGDRTVIVTAASSNDIAEPRSADLVFSVAGSDPVRIVITQSAAKLLFTADPGEIIFDSQQTGSSDIHIESNAEWNISGSGSWFSLSGTSGTGDQVITVSTLSPNNSLKERNSGLIFSVAGEDKDTVYIRQTGATPVLTVTPGNIIIDSNTGSWAELQIVSNTSWTLTRIIPWISVSVAGGNGNGAMLIMATDQNSSHDSRIDSLIFSADGTNPVVIKVIQNGAPNEVTDLNIVSFKIYPNPVPDLLIIEFMDDRFESIHIMNSGGSVIHSGKIDSPVKQIDFSRFGKGMYILEFGRTDGTVKRAEIIHL